MTRRELIASASLLLSVGTATRGLAQGSLPSLIIEAGLMKRGAVQPALLLKHGEHLVPALIDTLRDGSYAARLSPANEVLLRAVLRDQRIRVTVAGIYLLFDKRGSVRS